LLWLTLAFPLALIAEGEPWPFQVGFNELLKRSVARIETLRLPSFQNKPSPSRSNVAQASRREKSTIVGKRKVTKPRKKISRQYSRKSAQRDL
jgi:hypothetical protein